MVNAAYSVEEETIKFRVSKGNAIECVDLLVEVSIE